MEGWLWNIVAKGTRNQMLNLRVKKLEQWEALSVAITENLSLLDQTSYILVLNIGAPMNLTEYGVICVINML